ncbi:hypothetical protein C922_02362 [Plasmodium inui San Antonio 1]|uniref:Uncharacterized protein n=1 Tax=Plasmodium inui San Antonio 1 TaxID=1237626 RepID=W7A1X1_9APIC|nr:hypothetical protein C922_02362 [Plasmodium inui San Antonio 1]EUD67212.1 hypothetical protein C922_02362 [Plasmodium inui San Antonio 1]
MMRDYNGDVIHMEGNDLLINHVDSNEKGGKYSVRLFKLKSKNDKSRQYEINSSMSSEAFLKGYLHNSSDLVMLSDDTFSLYDWGKKKKNTLINLNDCEPIDFVYFKKNIIFIQKNKCSLFQARTNGRCSIMLNLKEPPVKVNFCSHKKNMIYLSTKSRIYFLKLLCLKDKTLKLCNTNMSLPAKCRQEEHVYHSHRNEHLQGRNEYKEVIHVCSYSCKDVTVYKLVKGKVKNKQKCLTKLDIRMLNDESIKGVFFFKVRHHSRDCNFGEESAPEGRHLGTSNGRGEEVRHVSPANEGEKSHDGEPPYDFVDSKEVPKGEGQSGGVEGAHEEETSGTSATKEYLTKLYLLIYSESGKVLIYLIDHLNIPHFKFGLAHVSKCPLAHMQLPFKVAQIYNTSDHLLKRVMKQKYIIKKKKENSPNFAKYMEHMVNKYAYINSNFFMDTIFMNEKSAVVYTIQIRHDFLTLPEEDADCADAVDAADAADPVLLKVMNSNEKIVAIKDVDDSEVKKNLVNKILSESKFSCYSDSDSYIDSDITWNDDSDKTDSCDEDTSDYSECDVTEEQGHVTNGTGDDAVKLNMPLPGGKTKLRQMVRDEASKNAPKSCAPNDAHGDLHGSILDDLQADPHDDTSAPEEEPSDGSSHETDHLKRSEERAETGNTQGTDEFEVTTNVSRNDGSLSNTTRENSGTHGSCSSTPSLGGSDTVQGGVEEEQTDGLAEAGRVNGRSGLNDDVAQQAGEERKKRKLKSEEHGPGAEIAEGNFTKRENVKKPKVGDSPLNELTCEVGGEMGGEVTREVTCQVTRQVTGDVADDVPSRNRANKTEDCFNDIDSHSEDERKNNDDESVITPSDTFLALSSMIKLNISLGRYHKIIMLVNVKGKKLIRDTVVNLGKKYSIKLLELLLNSLARNRFFLNTFFFWIKAICKEYKDTLKGRKHRRLVTKISLIAENNLKNECIIKHVINRIDVTIDHIRKNQISDNDEILNYQDGTIMK